MWGRWYFDAVFMTTRDTDLGLQAIKREMIRAGQREVAVGILMGAKDGEGASIAEYASHNEYGTESIPARPFMAMTFDESVSAIDADFLRQTRAVATGKRTADQALTVIGQKHADRVKNTISSRDIAPKLADSTVARKKQNSTKTLVDTGAMLNAVQISVRGRT
jgi:hypothetical protein